MNPRHLLLLSGLLIGTAHAADERHAANDMILATLFTSQSCSSCPPADVVMGELARRPDLLALSFHVDYWDHLGWKDIYSSAANTDRQQHYASAHGFQAYTPQLVVEGSRAVVGSNRPAVLKAIEQAHAGLMHAPISVLRKSGHQLDIHIGQMPGAGINGDIVLVSFDAKAETDIGAGENGGRHLAYYNSVRSTRILGRWKNQPLQLTTALADDEAARSLAVIVESDDGTPRAVSATSPIE